MRKMLRRCCAHVLSELTSADADLATLSKQLDQTGRLCLAELKQ